MGQVSTVDIHTRLEICELLTRYSHFADHDQGDEWADLFTFDGVFEARGMLRLAGREQLRTLPRMIAQQGGGCWRHQITNVMVDHAQLNEKRVRAYCALFDWGNGGAPVKFYDFTMTLHKGRRWQIAQLTADVIGTNGVGAEHALAA